MSALRVTLIAGFLSTLIMLAPVGLQSYARATFPENLSRISEFRTRAVTAIRMLGGVRAYAVFKDVYLTKDFNLQHNAAHLFGETLYDTLGVSGVHVCDTALNYGCYHGFLKGAISTEGLASIPELDSVCRAVSETAICQHGIGHGVLEYVGHENLVEALHACAGSPQNSPIAGCTSGVFMEYNVSITSSEVGTITSAVRPFDVRQPFGACTELEERYRQGCSYALPQWWHAAVAMAPADMGALCGKIVDSRERDACFTGLGSMLPTALAFIPDQVIAACTTISSESARTVCLIHAAGIFRMSKLDLVGAQRVCAALPRERQAVCNGATS